MKEFSAAPPLLWLLLALTPEPLDAQLVEAAKLKASDYSSGAGYGVALSASGDRALVGASSDSTSSFWAGSAYVLERSGGTWTEAAKLIASDGAFVDHFGGSVSLHGDAALVGARADDDSVGRAYVFERDAGGHWTEVGKLLASDFGAGDFFGVSVSLSGDRAMVGAPRNDDLGVDSGSVYVFERDAGGIWVQTAKLLASDGAAGNQFGGAVALSGDLAWIGATRDDHKSGSVYVFERGAGGAWTEVVKLKAGDGATDDFFGTSISISGSYALVGALLDDDQGADSGSAYVFERDAGGTWTEVAKLTASDGAPGDRFGNPCSLLGDLALVGAEYAGHAAGPKAGKAYLFQRGAGGTWTEVAKLQASDAKAFDRFGVAVSLLEDQVLVGAFWDDVEGPGSDTDSGSVYVFEPAACGPLLAPSEVVRPGSPPNPSALLPGITGGPVLGSTWDPVIDHASFLPGAAVDALAIAPTPLNLPIPALGTLLCDPSSALLIQTAAPGVPFAVSIPGDCAFAGVTLCSQGASLDALGGILLTNALDITLGTF